MPLHVPVSLTSLLKVEDVTIEEPKSEVLQAGDTAPVSLTQDVRTTIWSKTFTVPEGKTEVFISAQAYMTHVLPEPSRTLYVAVDGVDIASLSTTIPGWWWYWLRATGTVTLSAGTHPFTVDILCDAAGFEGYMWTDYACVLVCREPDSKYVSFSDTDVRTALTRSKQVKLIVGVNGIKTDDGDIEGSLKVTDKFGNEDEQYPGNGPGTDPQLYEFPFYDGVTLEMHALGSNRAYWINYLQVIYEIE